MPMAAEFPVFCPRGPSPYSLSYTTLRNSFPEHLSADWFTVCMASLPQCEQADFTCVG